MSDAVILRFNSDGTLDDSFGSGGIVVFPHARTWAIAAEVDGKIVVAGEGYDGLNYGALVLRYNDDGTLDDTFDYDGVAVYNSDTTEYESLNGLAITQEGKIVVVGTAFNPYTHSYDVLILRYNTDGTLDNTFGSDGVVMYNRPEWYDEAYSVATQADGKIVVTGESYSQITNTNAINLLTLPESRFRNKFGMTHFFLSC